MSKDPFKHILSDTNPPQKLKLSILQAVFNIHQRNLSKKKINPDDLSVSGEQQQ